MSEGVIAQELHNEAQLLLAQERFNRPHDPHLTTNYQPLPHLERLLPRQVTGRDDNITAPQLVAISNPRHGIEGTKQG